MTLFYQHKGSLATRCTILTTTADTPVYTATAGVRPVLHTLNLANVTGGAITTSVTFYQARTLSTTAILSGISLAASSRTTIDNIPLSMQEGDEIRVEAASADAVHVTVIVVEGMGPNQ